jgi:hypothetical protein
MDRSWGRRDFVDLLQKRVAGIAINSSSLRRQGPAGTIPAARAFCAKLDLRRAPASENSFREWLDDKTQQLMIQLPVRAQGNWGAARKVLNIFLRDVADHRVLAGASHGPTMAGVAAG